MIESIDYADLERRVLMRRGNQRVYALLERWMKDREKTRITDPRRYAARKVISFALMYGASARVARLHFVKLMERKI